MTYEIHPLAETMPAMSNCEYQDLLADITANGLTDPITLYEGKVLDGRNRLRACEEAEIEPGFDEYRGSDPAAFVIAKNIKRRHLTTGQKAMAVLKMNEVVIKVEEQAEERRLNNLKKGAHSPIPSRDGIGEKVTDKERMGESEAPDASYHQRDNKHANSATAKLGKLADVSEKTMERAKYIHDHGAPEDVEEVVSGKKTVNQKAKEIRARHKNNVKPGTSKASRGQKRLRPEAEDEMVVREWQMCIQAVRQTLLLNPIDLPPGETRDRVTRFLRALERKVVSQEAQDEMKKALEGLLDRCRQALLQLASVQDRSNATRPRGRARSTTTAWERFTPRKTSKDMFGDMGF